MIDIDSMQAEANRLDTALWMILQWRAEEQGCRLVPGSELLPQLAPEDRDIVEDEDDRFVIGPDGNLLGFFAGREFTAFGKDAADLVQSFISD